MHFHHLFVSLGLSDIAPPNVGPMWRNGRVGNEGISKILDRFLVAATLIPSLQVHRVWTLPSDISDHFPICLEWNKTIGSYNYPFKFNRSWLNDPDFSSWVTNIWSILSGPSFFIDCELLTHKIRSLKLDVNRWIKDKGSILESECQQIDSDICDILSGSNFGILSLEEQSTLA